MDSWIPALLVSIMALLFTVLSFWTLNYRRGRLKTFEPHSFAAVSTSAVMFVRLPLIFYNTGASPIVVQDMRLRFPDEPRSVLPLPWRTTRDTLMPKSDDGHQLPAVFACPGRSAERKFIEFGAPFPGFTFDARDYQAEISVKLGHKKDWSRLLAFTLRAAQVTEPDHYIAYSNSAFEPSPQDTEKASEALKGLLAKLDEASGRAVESTEE